jgi:hypothetical protein
MRAGIVDVVDGLRHVKLESGFASGHGEPEQVFAQRADDAAHLVSLNLALLGAAVRWIDLPDVAGPASAVAIVGSLPKHLVGDPCEAEHSAELVGDEAMSEIKVESGPHS